MVTLKEARSEYQKVQTIYQSAKEAAKREIDDMMHDKEVDDNLVAKMQQIEVSHFLPQYQAALERAEDRLIDIICQQATGMVDTELDDLRIQTVRMKIIQLALED